MYGGPNQYRGLQDPVAPLGPGLEFDDWVCLTFSRLVLLKSELADVLLTSFTTLYSGSEARKSEMLLQKREKLRF